MTLQARLSYSLGVTLGKVHLGEVGRGETESGRARPQRRGTCFSPPSPAFCETHKLNGASQKGAPGENKAWRAAM